MKNTLAQHLAADGSPKNILSLDGGGIRGALTLGFLKKIETILQDKQFAWVKEQGIEEPTDLIVLQHRVLHSKSTTPKDLLAYKQATKIAKEVLSEGYKPKYNFTHFYSKSRPSWANKKRKTRIGRHSFIRM